MARTWAEIKKLKPTMVERRLIRACRKGEPCKLGDDRPEGADPARTIRADILRYLILGGCDGCRTHEWGAQLLGGYIDGELDLSFATARGAIILADCRFARPPRLIYAKLEILTLHGSALPGLNAQGIQVTGTVFLRNGFSAEGRVSLSGATIGGQLDCTEGRFQNSDGHALNAEGIQVTGSVFLRNGFTAEGGVSLAAATIGGQLACTGGRFQNSDGHALNTEGIQVTGDVLLSNGFSAEGEVSLSGATIGGQLGCEGGTFQKSNGNALIAQRLRVTEGFLWRKASVPQGTIYLASAHVGDLVDDLQSWPEGGRIYLDGFTYDRISAAFTDSRERLEWLKRGTVWNDEFFPQPYAQLAKMLREMGHDRGARDVLVEQGQLIRLHAYRRAQKAGSIGQMLYPARLLWSALQRWIVGYGYKPFRSVIAAGLLWIIATGLGYKAWDSNAMVPNSDVILTSPGWQALADQPGPAKNWTAEGAPGQDWEVFNSLAWGFDVVVPIIQVGQIEAWAPSTTRGFWGQAAWWGRWGLSVAGWVVIALATAAVTGIIRRE